MLPIGNQRPLKTVCSSHRKFPIRPEGEKLEAGGLGVRRFFQILHNNTPVDGQLYSSLEESEPGAGEAERSRGSGSGIGHPWRSGGSKVYIQ